MQCPRCSNPLTEARRVGISIDVCTRCGGAWLDHGELTRIAARLWALQNGQEVEKETLEGPIRWEASFRYPRRHPKRRLGPIRFNL